MARLRELRRGSLLWGEDWMGGDFGAGDFFDLGSQLGTMTSGIEDGRVAGVGWLIAMWAGYVHCQPT